METVEQAHQIIAESIIDFIKSRDWDKGVCKCRIYSKMVSVAHCLERQGVEDNKSIGWPSKGISAADAALFLRDDILKATGHRVWGLIFILSPDGKFRIEYDYKKPEGYEDTDETIEVNLSHDIPHSPLRK